MTYNIRLGTYKESAFANVDRAALGYLYGRKENKYFAELALYKHLYKYLLTCNSRGQTNGDELFISKQPFTHFSIYV